MIALRFFCFALIIMGVGCRKKQPTPFFMVQSISGLSFVNPQDPVLLDVPFPVQSIIRTEHVNDSSFFIATYSGSKDQIVDFYISEMERLGWQHIQTFKTSQEIAYWFEKPHKSCTVSIRSGYIVILTTLKNNSFDQQ